MATAACRCGVRTAPCMQIHAGSEPLGARSPVWQTNALMPPLSLKQPRSTLCMVSSPDRCLPKSARIMPRALFALWTNIHPCPGWSVCQHVFQCLHRDPHNSWVQLLKLTSCSSFNRILSMVHNISHSIAPAVRKWFQRQLISPPCTAGLVLDPTRPSPFSANVAAVAEAAAHEPPAPWQRHCAAAAAALPSVTAAPHAAMACCRKSKVQRMSQRCAVSRRQHSCRRGVATAP